MAPKQDIGKAERAERLAQALRANLKRRKSQARGRKSEEDAQGRPERAAESGASKPPT